MLIDAFTYFNEKELVELRLKYLNSVVDYFVVIESNITFTGKEKKWNFPDVLKNNLQEFSHKIQYHQLNIKLEEIKNEESWIIDDIKGDDFWRIENFQRNYIKTACKKFSNNDILINLKKEMVILCFLIQVVFCIQKKITVYLVTRLKFQRRKN